MKKRSIRQQSRHNQAIRRSAGQYKAMGYSVKADIPGYPKPSLINGRRPDLEVKKYGKKTIIEFETPTTYPKDKEQRRVFSKFAKRNDNTKFKTKIAR